MEEQEKPNVINQQPKTQEHSLILQTLVGSRLHNLHTEKSDYDYRGIFIVPLIDFITPFIKTKQTMWIEDDVDNTSYELAYFCKMLVKGNPSALEVLFSDVSDVVTPIAQEMQDNALKFIDTREFINASRHYSHSQWNKFYNFESAGVNGQERAKFAVAFLRVMWQCEQFLLTGRFNCNLRECDMFELLKKIKPMTREEIQKVLPEIVEAMSMMDMRVAKAEGDADAEILNLKPDLEWIEKFIYRSYLSNNIMMTAETAPKERKDTSLIVAEETQAVLDAYDNGLMTKQELSRALQKNAKKY